MKKYLLAICLIPLSCAGLFAQQTKAQERKPFLSDEWTFSVYNNAISMPFSGKIGILHAPIHPGLSVGRSHYWNTKTTHQLFQTFQLGVFYQQYVQTGIQVYSAFNYRYQMPFGLGLGAHLGVGYLHAIRDLQQFELNSAGQYEKKINIGRPSIMIPAGLTFSYWINEKVRPFIAYQMWFQTPFSKEYIPILPNTSLHLGVTMPF
jgi:hypothetical protein